MTDEGKWEVTGPTGFLHQIGIGIRGGGGAIPIAVVYGNRDQAEPIARMMAASRDLLDALQDLVSWQVECKHPTPLTMLEKARAAITKATQAQS